MTTLQADRLLFLTKKVRAAQKTYFRERSQANLIASKVAESELDKHIVECEIKLVVEFDAHL